MLLRPIPKREYLTTTVIELFHKRGLQTPETFSNDGIFYVSSYHDRNRPERTKQGNIV